MFELLVIATAAAALSDEIFGFEARWAWTLAFGALALALGLLGPIGVVRTFVRKLTVWVVPVTLAYLGWWALTGDGLGAAWRADGQGGLSTWQAIDLVVGRDRLVGAARGRLHAVRTHAKGGVLGNRDRRTSSPTCCSSRSAPSSCSLASSAIRQRSPS